MFIFFLNINYKKNFRRTNSQSETDLNNSLLNFKTLYNLSKSELFGLFFAEYIFYINKLFRTHSKKIEYENVV